MNYLHTTTDTQRAEFIFRVCFPTPYLSHDTEFIELVLDTWKSLMPEKISLPVELFLKLEDSQD